LDGGIFAFGDAKFFGSLPSQHVRESDIVGIASTPDGGGYWLVGADGGVFSFGDAKFFGSVPGALGMPAPNPVTEIVATADGLGYWLVATDGGVFTFGDAGYYGSLPSVNITPNPARVAQSEVYFAYAASRDVFLQPTPDGRGYWIADSTGDVYIFGDASYYGSVPGALGSAVKVSPHDVVVGNPTTIPVTGFASTPDGRGYWMVGTDGSVYAFGDAPFFASLATFGIVPPPVTITGYTRPSTVDVSIPLSTVSGMARSPDGGGYWLTSLDGGVFGFGDAPFFGSVPGAHATIDSVASS
jgi:hypothetical protein